jgi:hypothetical protein
MMSPTKLVKVCLNCWATHKGGFREGVPHVPVSYNGVGASAPKANAPIAAPNGAAPQRGPVAHAAPSAAPKVAYLEAPGEYFAGPPVPLNPGPLPAWATAKNPVSTGNVFGMTGMAFKMMGAMKAYKDDPHLSREENAARRAQGISAAGGLNTEAEQTLAALKVLQERHLPEGLAGFVVTEMPKNGTLAQAHGLRPYDLIYGYETTLITKDHRPQQLSQDMQAAFQVKGVFSILVYSFETQRYRRVDIFMPPGKPNAILGIVSSQLPINESNIPGLVPEASMDMYVKAWRKQGGMYISSGGNAVPLYAPLTSENEGLYVKVARHKSGMWISTGEYHPLYNYVRLNEPLFVEVWRYRNGMLIRNGSEYAALPMERISADSAMPSSVPLNPAAPSNAGASPAYQQMPQQGAPMDPQQMQQQYMMQQQQYQMQQQQYQMPQQMPQQQMPQQMQQQQMIAQPMQNQQLEQSQANQHDFSAGMASGAGYSAYSQFASPDLQQRQIAQASANGIDLSAQMALMSQYSGTGVAGMPNLNTAEGIPPQLASDPNMIQQLIASSHAAAAAAAAGSAEILPETAQTSDHHVSPPVVDDAPNSQQMPLNTDTEANDSNTTEGTLQEQQ